jgi:hypothetical protein
MSKDSWINALQSELSLLRAENTRINMSNQALQAEIMKLRVVDHDEIRRRTHIAALLRNRNQEDLTFLTRKQQEKISELLPGHEEAPKLRVQVQSLLAQVQSLESELAAILPSHRHAKALAEKNRDLSLQVS